ncbi:MAG: flavodoxin, partial [Thermomicrobiales bacterium]
MQTNRRALLGGVAGLIGAQASNQYAPRPASASAALDGTPEATPGIGSRVLLAYFSRAGENYYYGDTTVIEFGNTQIVADMIASLIAVDIYRIEAAHPYPDSYRETVERNVREQNEDARPAIANPLPAIDGYDT